MISILDLGTWIFKYLDFEATSSQSDLTCDLTAQPLHSYRGSDSLTKIDGSGGVSRSDARGRSGVRDTCNVSGVLTMYLIII